MSYTYWLPDANGAKKDYTTESNAVVIIGANGAGKSKLGAWIEQKSMVSVHRIAAQRSLNFQENTPLKSYSQAEAGFFYGGDTHSRNKGARWNYGNSYTTQLVNDFDDVLSAMIALRNNANDKFVAECKTAEAENKTKPNTPNTVIDKLQEIWKSVFPHRELIYDDAKFYASFVKNGNEVKYSANQMSDGERAVLYLTSQVLCVPQNKILIMDEPEIHLHRSLINRLWVALENARKDCLFIYITHDTQFAALHSHADKIWVQSFDGANWNLQKLEDSDLPEELLLDILGNRKNVLFVEGEKDSYDSKLYSVLYPNYYVVPCGSCTQVIARTKAFKNNPTLHHCSVYGIIDRDFRCDYEIEKYKEDNIYTINVAEVENLFLVEELLRLIATHLATDVEKVFADIKKYVVDERFANQITGQICESVVAQIKYKLTCAEISKKNETEAKTTLESTLASINYDDIKAQEETKFKDALNSGNYAQVLRVFNKKQISKTIGHYFGLNDDAYCQFVINLLKTDKKDEIIAALLPYLPTEVPRGETV